MNTESIMALCLEDIVDEPNQSKFLSSCPKIRRKDVFNFITVRETTSDLNVGDGGGGLTQ